MKNTQQATVRQINSHLFAGTGYCMIYADGWQARISWARTNKGTKQGRVINMSHGPNAVPEVTEDRSGMHWVAIPSDAKVELS